MGGADAEACFQPPAAQCEPYVVFYSHGESIFSTRNDLSVCLSVCMSLSTTSFSQRHLSLNDVSLPQRPLCLPLSLATNCASLNELLKQPLFLSKQRLLSPPLPPLSNQFSLQVSYYRHLISARTRCICTEGRASAPRHNQGGAYPRGAC